MTKYKKLLNIFLISAGVVFIFFIIFALNKPSVKLNESNDNEKSKPQIIPKEENKEPVSITPKPAEEKLSWKTYKNLEYGFSIDYPENWRAATNDYSGSPNMIFCSPNFFGEKDDAYVFPYGCAITRRIYPNEDGSIDIEGIGNVSGKIAEDWTKAIKKPISEVYFFLGIKKKGQSEWCPLTNSTIAGLKADVRDCRENGSDRIDIFWEKSPYYFSIAIDGTITYPKNKDIFDRMISSFKFLN